MNKTAIKNFAIQSRKDLIQGVSQKAYELGITKDNVSTNTITSSDAFVVFGKVLDTQTKKQRNELIAQISIKGYTQVMEEVAYTWFNRFIALRYMEVNGYLPSKIRVFTNHSNEFRPELLDQALYVNFEGVNKEKVLEYLDKNDDEGLYKYLFIAQCNDMNQYLPEMFEKIGNYTELLLPDGLLKPNGVLANMIRLIDEEDWKEQVEIIGWLYQYYNSEVKDQVINIYKGVVKKEDIPAATQLFTTDWVVRYMVDNSLGKFWLERNPNSTLKSKLEYYMPYDPVVISEKIEPTELRVFDPCMGSGHILVYAFDVLIEIYAECGYSPRDAAKLIVENNLYGLDIDDRAYQLAYFAVMMKARHYSRRILNEPLENHLASITESDSIEGFNEYSKQLNFDNITIAATNEMIDFYRNAKEFGSLLDASNLDVTSVERLQNYNKTSMNDLFVNSWREQNNVAIDKLIKQTKILSQKYQAVVTNPPYLNKMDGKLKAFVQKHFKDYSTDLFSVFMYRNFNFCTSDGYSAFMTPFVWMFIKSYEKLREHIITTKNVTSLIQMEYSAFEEATVPICSFILSNKKDNTNGVYIKLSDFKGGMNVQKEKVLEVLADNTLGYLYKANTRNFSKIPGSPIAYWLSRKFIDCFTYEKLSAYAFAGIGMRTGDNARFLRLWHEVFITNAIFGCTCYIDQVKSRLRWVPYNKGGEFRKWYGNNDYLVNWMNNGEEIKENTRINYPSIGDNLGWKISNESYYFKEGITWSGVTSGDFSCRYYGVGFIFDSGANGMFPYSEDYTQYLMAILNSKVGNSILKAINPTINTGSGTINQVPIIACDDYQNDIKSITIDNVLMSKSDWDSYETSWDFERHPLMKYLLDDAGKKVGLISTSFGMWSEFAEKQFYQLKANEEELNRIFIEIYGLQDELTPEVEEKDVTVRKADLGRDIRSFVSYAVGCLFGRYSLDVDGLAYAGGEWDASKYKTILPDADNIIPISDEAYFEDDLLSRFVEFVRVVFGSDTLEENLEFIANALGTKGTSARDAIRNYLLNDFYKDHVKIYQKRPIYWLFDSGKQNGFKALIYMHRYNQDTLAKMRIDYVHRTQEHYRNEIVHLSDAMDRSENQKDRVRFGKEIEKLKAKEDELLRYEQVLHHMADQRIAIDLDDGVVVNYAKFDGLVSKIK